MNKNTLLHEYRGRGMYLEKTSDSKGDSSNFILIDGWFGLELLNPLIQRFFFSSSRENLKTLADKTKRGPREWIVLSLTWVGFFSEQWLLSSTTKLPSSEREKDSTLLVGEDTLGDRIWGRRLCVSVCVCEREREREEESRTEREKRCRVTAGIFFTFLFYCFQLKSVQNFWGGKLSAKHCRLIH